MHSSVKTCYHLTMYSTYTRQVAMSDEEHLSLYNTVVLTYIVIMGSGGI